VAQSHFFKPLKPFTTSTIFGKIFLEFLNQIFFFQGKNFFVCVFFFCILNRQLNLPDLWPVKFFLDFSLWLFPEEEFSSTKLISERNERIRKESKSVHALLSFPKSQLKLTGIPDVFELKTLPWPFLLNQKKNQDLTWNKNFPNFFSHL